MGKGIDLARPDAPLHAQIIDDFKDQLLIAFLRRLGADKVPVAVPVTEVDQTGRWLCAFKIDDGAFHFELRKKQ